MIKCMDMYEYEMNLLLAWNSAFIRRPRSSIAPTLHRCNRSRSKVCTNAKCFRSMASIYVHRDDVLRPHASAAASEERGEASRRSGHGLGASSRGATVPGAAAAFRPRAAARPQQDAAAPALQQPPPRPAEAPRSRGATSTMADWRYADAACFSSWLRMLMLDASRSMP